MSESDQSLQQGEMDGGYGEHPLFETPPRDEPIGRYMTLDKFADLIGRSELYFARADVLVDQFEGRVPSAVEQFQAEELARSIQADRAILEAAGEKIEWFDNSPAALEEGRRRHRESHRSRTYISCWHLSANESQVMWDRFTPSGGVLLATNFGLLERALPKRWEYAIYAGKITYSDYEPTTFPMGNTFDAFLHKRKAFADERELRVMFNVHSRREVPVGLRVPVDVKTLAKQVILAPGCGSREASRADRILERAGIALRCERSTLS